ncbi:unnamed protein product [Rotaria sordida]|uniref:NAD(P)(+)--arginine ADP-ribosyltransferase n=1 Tax=Rotaria sordida TaxID=392033 RepID=A0A814GW26_9BILA|nr:unnamed protein product [Rotaria sordida]CAF0826657.1 unnamed protein product [Rotaria sordida]CAF0859928.1 unnamed protein product [Rotaria sordida]CAF1001750.1 unnamed protein product [Rotaria sordida]CAF1085851.1 unnamed protein product [Rotaria sordida]
MEKKVKRQVKESNDDIQSDQTRITIFDKIGNDSQQNTEEYVDQRQETIISEDTNETIDNASTRDRIYVEHNREEINSVIMNDVNDFKKSSNPILGYVDEPLLPLVKACAPLNDILHDLSKYVQLALNETPEEPLDNLTIDESAAIRLYTIEWNAPHRSLYSMLNHTLKTGTREDVRPYFKYLKLFLTAVIKLPCLPQLTVWRGVTRNLRAEFPPGTLVTWWPFSSCTTSLTVLQNNMYLGISGDRTLFSVEVINGRSINGHSHFVTEDEVLLLPGTHMEDQSQVSPAPELYIVHLKQLIPEEVLLEPPFEGIANVLSYLFYIKVLFLCLGARIFPKIKRSWYRKKRYIIPICFLMAIFIGGAIIGAVVGSKLAANKKGR